MAQPISVTVEDENGKIEFQIATTSSNVDFIINHSSENDLLKYIDIYGDTIFNRFQCMKVKKELIALLAKVPGEDITKDINNIIFCCEMVVREPHLYLKFNGN